MATILRGPDDQNIRDIVAALGEYEAQFPGSEASVYRQNPGDVRVRIIDKHFEGMSKSRRHDRAWDFLSQRLKEDVMGEIAALILLPVGELGSSLANLDFEEPLPSKT